MGATVVDLQQWRTTRDARREQVEMRVTIAARSVALRLTGALRANGKSVPDTLRDAARRLENSHHRPLAPKLVREITDAIAAGVPPQTISEALHAFAAEVEQAAEPCAGRAA